MLGKTVHYTPNLDEQCRAALVVHEVDDDHVALVYIPYIGNGTPTGPMFEFVQSAAKGKHGERGTFHALHD